MSTVSNSAIARTLIARLQAGEPMQDVSKKLAAYLIDERRQGEARTIIREVERRMLNEFGVLYVRATSAHALNQAQIATIQQTFMDHASGAANKVVVEQIIDPTVIGGVRCETADARLDLTVRRQLQQLKKQTV